MRIRTSLVFLLGAACAPALAQTPPADSPRPPDRAGQPAPPAPQRATFGNAKARQERLLKAAQLPKKAEEMRAKGVPENEMKEALNAAKAKGVRPDEMSDAVDEGSKAIDQHGRIDNFGAFVKSKLNDGLRGRELSAAIRAEHAKRGMGPGNKAERAKKPKPDKAEADDDAVKEKNKDKAKNKNEPKDKDKDKDKNKDKGKNDPRKD